MYVSIDINHSTWVGVPWRTGRQPTWNGPTKNQKNKQSGIGHSTWVGVPCSTERHAEWPNTKNKAPKKWHWFKCMERATVQRKGRSSGSNGWRRPVCSPM